MLALLAKIVTAFALTIVALLGAMIVLSVLADRSQMQFYDRYSKCLATAHSTAECQ